MSDKLTGLKETVLNSQDKQELFVAEVELTELIGSFHKSIKLSETEMDKCDQKSYLGLADSLLGICRDRQKEVGMLDNKINYNFRTAAKVLLKKETYDRIYSYAQMPRRAVVENRKELKANKIE